MPTNLLPNGGFEVDTSGWLRLSTLTATITRDTTKAYAGAASGRWDTTDATYLSTGTNDAAALPGRPYSVSARLTGSGTVAVGAVFLDASNAVIGSPTTTEDTALSGSSWTRLEVRTPAPAGAAWVRLRIYQRTTGANSVWIDGPADAHLIEFTATPLPGLAAVRLEAVNLPALPATITRTDLNGSGTVRQLPGQLPSGGQLVVVDYEPALTGTVSYHISTGGAEDTSTALDLAAPVLHVAGRPNLRADVAAVTGITEASDSPAAVVHVLDRADPLVLLAEHHLPTGSLTVWCATYADARAVVTLARDGRRVMFRQTDYPGMDRYVAVTGATLDPVTAAVGAVQRWAVRLDYAEVATPDTDLQAAAGWDFAELASSYATFSAVTAAFGTFKALTVGP